VEYLQKGTLNGAILDVFQQEPLSPTSPLWVLPGVTITPHVSALSLSSQTVTVFLDNLMKYLDLNTLNNQVNWELGY